MVLLTYKVKVPPFSDWREILEMLRYSRDVVIDVGDDEITLGHVFTCLLYTSPSPRDLSTSRMPSSA